MVGGSGGTLTLFAYDGARVAYELDGTTLANATLTRSYAYNSYIDSPLMMIDEDGSAGGPVGFKFYYLQDRRFSAIALIDTSGNILERYRYQAFGIRSVHRPSGGWNSSTNNTSLFQNPYGYTGRRYDPETATASSQGLWYYRNRMYSSKLGRFLQRDPAGYIDGFNLYAYVRNNPLAFLDPSGLLKMTINTLSQQARDQGSPVLIGGDANLRQLLGAILLQDEIRSRRSLNNFRFTGSIVRHDENVLLQVNANGTVQVAIPIRTTTQSMDFDNFSNVGPLRTREDGFVLSGAIEVPSDFTQADFRKQIAIQALFAADTLNASQDLASQERRAGGLEVALNIVLAGRTI